jgi:hypothetical protein
MITFSDIKKFKEEAAKNKYENKVKLRKSVIDLIREFKLGLKLPSDSFKMGNQEHKYVSVQDGLRGGEIINQEIYVNDLNQASVVFVVAINEDAVRPEFKKVMINVFIKDDEVQFEISMSENSSKYFGPITSKENVLEVCEFIKQFIIDQIALEHDYNYGHASKKESINLWD